MNTSLRARRFANRPIETTHPFIAFRLRQDWFALSLDAVQRVVSLSDSKDENSSIKGSQQDIRVTTVDPMEWTPIAIEQQIFLDTSDLSPAPRSNVEEEAPIPQFKATCLILLKHPQGKIFGFPIDSQPQIHRIPASRIEPFSPSHPSHDHIRCISSILTLTPESPPLLLLDPSQLYETESVVCSS